MIVPPPPRGLQPSPPPPSDGTKQVKRSATASASSLHQNHPPENLYYISPPELHRGPHHRLARTRPTPPPPRLSPTRPLSPPLHGLLRCQRRRAGPPPEEPQLGVGPPQVRAYPHADKRGSRGVGGGGGGTPLLLRGRPRFKVGKGLAQAQTFAGGCEGAKEMPVREGRQGAGKWTPVGGGLR